MNLCVCVYPQKNCEKENQLKDYLHLAKQSHFNEVFTSIHLPEFTMQEQASYLAKVAECAFNEELELTVDIGGPFIKEALENESIMKVLKDAHIAYLRLDYGYTFEQLKILYTELNLKGFVMNASMYTCDQIQKHIQFFQSIDPDMKIKACHNFYVREESGLDQDFALSQSHMFEKLSIPVYYCVPCHDAPRGPLHLGLPTIEQHRYLPMDLVLMDLIHTYHAESLMFSDEWMSENTFQLIYQTLIRKEIPIPVILKENITLMEKRIVLKSHVFRYDSNDSFLRSRSSREMAEMACVIDAHNIEERKEGSITIDNQHYLRYSGELQVVLSDAKKDERVNVCGFIQNPQDLIKLKYHRSGFTYHFTE